MPTQDSVSLAIFTKSRTYILKFIQFEWSFKNWSIPFIILFSILLKIVSVFVNMNDIFGIILMIDSKCSLICIYQFISLLIPSFYILIQTEGTYSTIEIYWRYFIISIIPYKRKKIKQFPIKDVKNLYYYIT